MDIVEKRKMHSGSIVFLIRIAEDKLDDYKIEGN